MLEAGPATVLDVTETLKTTGLPDKLTVLEEAVIVKLCVTLGTVRVVWTHQLESEVDEELDKEPPDPAVIAQVMVVP